MKRPRTAAVKDGVYVVDFNLDRLPEPTMDIAVD
jgi:hypothetical protein